MACRREQPDIVLRHLRRRHITAMDAFRKYNITRLEDVIHKLRRRGHVIVTELRKGNGTRYAIYRLAR